MANSHVSYLQTLAKDEAVAFVASLQKVKEHLSHELHWVNEQVQQKTIQLQGIETLLSEAAGLGIAPSYTASTPGLTASASEVSASSVAEAVLSSVSQATAPPPAPAELAAANGNNPTVSAAAPTGSSVVAPAAASVPNAATSAPPKRGKRQQSQSSKPKQDTKLAAAKPSTAKAEKPVRSTAPSSEASKAPLSGFQKFLQTGFQDKSMTEAVGEILKNATKPLNTDAIMAELYHGLSNDSYQRAKSSLSNILSVGKTKGKWKSPARGMYMGNAVAAKAK
ncbi:hypothetical protein [Stenomitos frigidus]|uniref:Uncharacterized protein n=1 Tax=Stenomitos frigidus ULC18 TaxID=2107698 RepID=A0A2T1EDT1_9CYAN|nr:hypothetical protein [Stenomitos frigidus]PSB30855.1 hypothetical protein C7B82_07965 [Stenomitos frigidus ULC18]